MIYIAILAVIALIMIPILIAIAESQRLRISTDDEGFWTLSRALMGGCHIKWRPDPMPVVWFDVGLSQGRIHIAQRAGETAWWFEGRIYLSSPLGFAARLHTPAEVPLQPSLPNMKICEDEERDGELKLSGFSIESNAAPRLMQCLSDADLRRWIKSLKSSLKVGACEIIFAHHVFVVRGRVDSDDKPSDIAERIGPHLANWMRQIVVPLNQSSDRMINRADAHLCPVSASDLRYGYEHDEVWQCPNCHQELYRAAMEIMKGCVNPSCSHCIDGVDEKVLFAGRPHVEIKEVEQNEVGDLGWIQGSS